MKRTIRNQSGFSIPTMMALGIAAGAYERSLEYSRQRKAFGKSVSQFGLIQRKISSIAVGRRVRLLASRAHSVYTAEVEYALA